MKILPTNFLTNYNTSYFSEIQNKNNYSLQNFEEKSEKLPQLDAVTSRVYYKFINNNQISFGENVDNNNAKKINQYPKRSKEEELAILQALEDAILAGKTLNDFYRENGYTKDIISTILKHHKEREEKIKQIIQKKLIAKQKNREALIKELEEYILSGKKIVDFYREKGYTRGQIDNLLTRYTNIRQEKKQTKRKEDEVLLKELKEYLAEGKTITDFCRERKDKTERIKYLIRWNKPLREEINDIKKQARLAGKTQGQRSKNPKTMEEKAKKRELILLDLEIARSLGMTTEEFCEENGYKLSTINLLLRRYKKAAEEIEKQSSPMPNRTWLIKEDFDNRIFGHKKLMNVSLATDPKQSQKIDKINNDLKASFPANTVFWIENYDVSNIGKYPLEKYIVNYRIYKSPDNKQSGYFGTTIVKKLNFISTRKNAYKTFINHLIKQNKEI